MTGVIPEPLSIAFENLWQSVKVPEDRKWQIYCPTFKGIKEDPVNSRSISLTLIFGKILEHIFKQSISKILVDNKSDVQTFSLSWEGEYLQMFSYERSHRARLHEMLSHYSDALWCSPPLPLQPHPERLQALFSSRAQYFNVCLGNFRYFFLLRVQMWENSPRLFE